MILYKKVKGIVIILIAIEFVGCSGVVKPISEICNAFAVVDEGLEEEESEEFQSDVQGLERSSIIEDSLLRNIVESGDSGAIKSSQIIVKHSSQIEEKIEAIKKELVNANFIDENGEIENKRDKEQVSRIMLEEGRAHELEECIKRNADKLSQLKRDLELPKSESLDKLYSNLNTPQGEDWAEFNFQGMPVFAVFPIFIKIQNDAKMTRIEFLEKIDTKRN